MAAQDDNRFEEFAQFARDLAKAAGTSILPHFRQALAIDNKSSSGFDPVTQADRAAESTMRTMIGERFPDHGIIGEEFGTAAGTSGYSWILDPIDGTRSFMCGLPTWTTLIGLYHEENPLLGVVSQPFVDEIFIGGPFGSWSEHKNTRRRLHVNPAPDLASATLTTVTPEMYNTAFHKRVLETMQKQTRMIRFGGDAYFFAMLAAGRVDIAMDAGLAVYDVAAVVPLIENAGGTITTWDGGRATAGGDILAAASKELHKEAMAIIRSARA